MDPSVYDMKEAPACIKAVWFNLNKHPNNEWRWRLLSFFRGVGVSPLDAQSAIIDRWKYRLDNNAVSSIQHMCKEPTWSRFREAGCVGKDRCCRAYINSMPHNYLHEARFKYMKCPRTDKWIQYTTITNYNGETTDIIIDEQTRGFVQPTSTQKTTSDDGFTAYEYYADPGPIAYYQPTTDRLRAQTDQPEQPGLSDYHSGFSSQSDWSCESI